MNIIICGAGRVGFSISKQLSAQGHSITVIDQSSEFIQKINDTQENVLSYPLKEAREKFEKNYLTSQLKKHKGNISKTAEFVGMERSALHRKLKTLGIKGVN